MAAGPARDAAGDLMRYIARMDARLTDRTKREYAGKLKDLSRRITPRGSPLTPRMVIDELQRIAAEEYLAGSTFRSFTSATMYWLGQQAQALIASGGDPGEYAEAFASVREIRYRQKEQEGRPTRLRYFPAECLEALVHYARERGYRAPNALRALAFVRANLLVGLRPIEWFDVAFASYLERNDRGEFFRDANGRIRFVPMLIVSNAKATHGRANGPSRELVLHEITVEELKTLVHFREIAVRFKARHARADSKTLTNLFYRPLNQAIRRAVTAYAPVGLGAPSSYSTRHQVVADFKSTGLTPRQIAAFFGHRSQRTHREHYGHKRHGRGSVTFRPSAECLARVAPDRSVRATPEVLSAVLAAEIELWASEQVSRKTPGTG